jgi:hypothetical protein
MAGAGARRAAWNLALMQDGLAPAYARLLVEMSGELGPTEALFRWGVNNNPHILYQLVLDLVPASLHDVQVNAKRCL